MNNLGQEKEFFSPKRKRMLEESTVSKGHLFNDINEPWNKESTEIFSGSKENRSFDCSVGSGHTSRDQDSKSIAIMNSSDVDSSAVEKWTNNSPQPSKVGLDPGAFIFTESTSSFVYPSRHRSGLNKIKSSNIFDADTWNSRYESPFSNDGDGAEFDESINRLLSESDTSIDKKNKFRSKDSSPSKSFVLNINKSAIKSRRGPTEYSVARMSSPCNLRETNNIQLSSPNFKIPEFGTPMTEVGSPAVLDDFDYPLEDSGLMDLSSERDRDALSVGAIENERTSRVVSGDIDSMCEYDAFAFEIMRSSADRKHRNNISAANTSDGELSDSMLSFSNRSLTQRPLPDLSAFDGMHSKHVSSSGPFSPFCPPTPSRALQWPNKTASDLECLTISDSFLTCQMPQMEALMRQNSLGDNKVLLSTASGDSLSGFKSHESQQQVLFHRDFTIEGVLGTGTFADVYKVSDTVAARFQRPTSYYAVKRIKRQFKSRKDREWLLHEVLVMKRLGATLDSDAGSIDSNHCPYVVHFIRAWQEDSHFFVQMSLASLGSLKDALSRVVASSALWPADSLWHILHDTAAGLQHIHACGFVHMDIKPANILINETGVLQIGDFGMTSEVGSTDDSHEGDQRYMAPELLNFAASFPSADVFSLGMTLHELAQCPASNGLPTDGPLWHAFRDGSAPKLGDHLPIEFQQCVYACLSPSPEARPSAVKLTENQFAMAMRDSRDSFLISMASSKPVAKTVYRTDSYIHSSLDIHIPDPEEQARFLADMLTPH